MQSHRSVDRWEQLEFPHEIEQIVSQADCKIQGDIFRCAEMYNLAYPGYDGDRAFYLAKAKCGRVLYLGIGSGRIFADIARLNHAAVGIEKSSEMIDCFRLRHPGVIESQILLGDVLTADLGESLFDCVLGPYSFLQVLPNADVPVVLKKIKTALKVNGAFITDTFSPYLIPFRHSGPEVSTKSANPDFRISIYISYDHLKQEMREYAVFDDHGRKSVTEMCLHYYFPRELEAMIQDAGFKSCSISGGYCGEAFNPATNDVIVFEATA